MDYEALFALADLDKDGFIGPEDASTFFRKSGLTDTYLGEIWKKATNNNSISKLSQTEFTCAVKLVSLLQNGKPMPVNLQSLLNEDIPLPTFQGVNLQSSTSPTTFTWKINNEQREKWTAFFQTKATNGFIAASIATQVFLPTTKVTMQHLSQIWNLSDFNKDAKLDLNEFLVSQFLVFAVESGEALPNVGQIPQSLFSSIQSNNDSTPLKTDNDLKFEPCEDANHITQQFWDKNSKIFKKYAVNGFVNGDTAKEVLVKSQLSNALLVTIWGLCDMDLDNQLSEREFILAMFLIGNAKTTNQVKLENSVLQSLDNPINSTKNQNSTSGLGFSDNFNTTDSNSNNDSFGSDNFNPNFNQTEKKKEKFKPNYDIQLPSLEGSSGILGGNLDSNLRSSFDSTQNDNTNISENSFGTESKDLFTDNNNNNNNDSLLDDNNISLNSSSEIKLNPDLFSKKDSNFDNFSDSFQNSFENNNTDVFGKNDNFSTNKELSKSQENINIENKNNNNFSENKNSSIDGFASFPNNNNNNNNDFGSDNFGSNILFNNNNNNSIEPEKRNSLDFNANFETNFETKTVNNNNSVENQKKIKEKENLTSKLEETKQENIEIEKNLKIESDQTENLENEIKELENQILEQKVKTQTNKERLNLVKNQITSLKQQKIQFEVLLEEKIEQYNSEKELLDIVQTDLQETNNQIQNQEQKIKDLTKLMTETRQMRKQSVQNLSKNKELISENKQTIKDLKKNKPVDIIIDNSDHQQKSILDSNQKSGSGVFEFSNPENDPFEANFTKTNSDPNPYDDSTNNNFGNFAAFGSSNLKLQFSDSASSFGDDNDDDNDDEEETKEEKTIHTDPKQNSMPDFSDFSSKKEESASGAPQFGFTNSVFENSVDPFSNDGVTQVTPSTLPNSFLSSQNDPIQQEQEKEKEEEQQEEPNDNKKISKKNKKKQKSSEEKEDEKEEEEKEDKTEEEPQEKEKKEEEKKPDGFPTSNPFEANFGSPFQTNSDPFANSNPFPTSFD